MTLGHSTWPEQALLSGHDECRAELHGAEFKKNYQLVCAVFFNIFLDSSTWDTSLGHKQLGAFSALSRI